ncbi:TatD family hydrolase [Pseudoalteromonas arctica]|uniref:YchF/TatD family DNA exonuclease n=1 Tax=Pseudoalteromonas arctica TaxID=394751 RepID=A0A7Y0HAH9_9GAMM|nr:TatD family hydrolase [Pseudoalteromonas arctica]NMM40641.1 YchF/TatD family DNA exonuclease [Pseudoalteromonas arctica]
MTISLIDAGVNLTNHQFDAQHSTIIARAKAQNVSQMLLIGCDINSSQQAINLAQQHSLLATAGVHPHDAKSADEKLETQLRTLTAHSEVVAIGECGLDYNRNFSPRETQRSVLHRQLTLAGELNLPVYLHERDASEDMLAILQQYSVRGVLHCFTGDQHALEQYLSLGLYIGITGWVCDERRGKSLQKLMPMLPLERLLIETDAPFLLPRSLTPKPKSHRNEPSYLPHICQTIASLKGLEFATVAKKTTLNFQQLFNHKG